MDICVFDLKDEVWEVFVELFLNFNIVDLLCVQFGLGVELCYFYFIIDKLFCFKKLWISEGKYCYFDKKKGCDVWFYDWEIELFGISKQVVVLLLIYLESGKFYLWLCEFDFVVFDLGIGLFMFFVVIECLVVVEYVIYEFEICELLMFGFG